MTKRILIVDDDDPIRRMLARILKLGAEGLEITEARDGPEALRLLDEEGPFDLIVLDHMMPQMSGMEVLQTIRESPDKSELPVIMLTARAEQNLDSLKRGADYFIAKPFEPQELLDSVGQVLGISMQA